jgi:hypothetical protein
LHKSDQSYFFSQQKNLPVIYNLKYVHSQQLNFQCSKGLCSKCQILLYCLGNEKNFCCLLMLLSATQVTY